jgi:hypothetical protein
MITVEVDPAPATVVMARRYLAADLYAEFRAKWESKYRRINDSFAAWAGGPIDRHDGGWTIASGVPSPMSGICSHQLRACARTARPDISIWVIIWVRARDQSGRQPARRVSTQVDG